MSKYSCLQRISALDISSSFGQRIDNVKDLAVFRNMCGFFVGRTEWDERPSASFMWEQF